MSEVDMAYTTTIHFLGLILFVTNSPDVPLQAILPRVPHHQSFIAFPPGSTTKVWPEGRAKGQFKDAKDQPWEYILLDGEEIEFNAVAGKAEKPTFLAQMNDGCCRMVGSVRNSYKPEGEKQAANIRIRNGDVGWSKERDRIDTIINLETKEDHLVITGDGGNQEGFELTFKKDTKIVIGNFDLKTIGAYADADHPEHFKHYYRMLTFGWLCNATIELEGGCSPDLNSETKEPVIVTRKQETSEEMLASRPVHTHDRSGLFWKKVKYLGVEIECSNSQYP